MELDRLTRLYSAYVDTFRDAGGRLPEMMQLKLCHTGRVVENAALIADGEGWSAPEKEEAQIVALLHDTGRYEQLKLYNTFHDSESVDHAVFSHDIVRREGWTNDEDILAAVLFRNRRELPQGMDERRSRLCKVVRDADKLDIFRILESQLAENPDLRQQAFWGLENGAPSAEVIAAIRERRPVDYQHIRTLPDFVLIQVGWMISGLEYATSRRLVRERGHLEFRRRFLKSLTSSPVIDEICDMAL